MFLFQFEPAYAKESNTKFDSLKTELLKHNEDTSQVNILNSLAAEYSNSGNTDSSMKYYNEAIRLSKQLEFKAGLTEAYSNKGLLYDKMGNYPAAIDNFQLARTVYELTGDRKAVAQMFNLIANAYHKHNDFPNALKNQYAALKIREEIGDKEGMAWSYNNIGILYRIHGDLEDALKNSQASNELLKKYGQPREQAKGYASIGNIYSLMGRYNDALNSYYQSLQIRLPGGDKSQIIESWLNIADSYCDLYAKDSVSTKVKVDIGLNESFVVDKKNWLDSAMVIHHKVQKLNEEVKNEYYDIFSFSGLGRVYFLKRNYSESIRLYSKAYAIATKLEEVELQQEIAKYLSDNYNGMRDFKSGMKWYMIYETHKDTLFSRLKSDDLTRARLNYEFEKKENEARVLQEQKDAVAKVVLDRQKKIRNLFQSGFALVLIFAVIFLFQRNHIRREKVRSDNLLLNILPSEIATELKQTGSAKTQSFKEISVLFADFVDFTKISERITPEELVKEIHACFSAFDLIIQKHHVEKIKTIGDAYLCAGGLPVIDHDHALNIVNVALEMRQFMHDRKMEREARNEIGFELRIGIHSGPVVAGIVGVKKYAYDIWGDTVNIAARMEQNSQPGKINISHKTFDIVKDHFECTYRGKIQAKNKGEIDMYFLEPKA